MRRPRSFTQKKTVYTFTTVPKQVKQYNGNKAREYDFLFKLGSEENVSIKLRHGVTFLFTGRLLTHRQICNMPCDYDNDLFLILRHMEAKDCSVILIIFLKK